MTKTAMYDLMNWATKMPGHIQSTFAGFYQLNYLDALNDEMLGGRPDESTITSQMMRMLIDKFEEQLNLPRTFTQAEIYK